MNIHKRLEMQKANPKFFLEVLNGSFPVLNYACYKHGLNDEVCMWPLKMVYDESYSPDWAVYSEIVMERIGEKEISLNGYLTLAGLLKYGDRHKVDAKVVERTIKEVVKINEKLGYDDILLMFRKEENENRLFIDNEYNFRDRCYSFVEGCKAQIQYFKYLQQADTLRLKGVSVLHTVNMLFHLHFTDSTVK